MTWPNNSPERPVVFSTGATDVFINQAGDITATKPGGPLMFIENALDVAGVSHDIFEADPIEVHILMTPEGEFGKVPVTPPTRLLSELGRTPLWAIMSSILNEWRIDTLDIPERLFVDVQGFVRDGTDFGGKRLWDIDPAIAEKIFCIKGTDEELGYLDPALVEAQKQRMLVVTRGVEGVEVFSDGERYLIPARTVENIPDTIGAGDTFFAYFFAAMYGGSDAVTAGEYAVEKTAEFLRAKRN